MQPDSVAGASFPATVDNPGKRLGQRFTEAHPAGGADGRPAQVSPLLEAVVRQLTHQGAVREEHEGHLPGLARAALQLTIAHAHMLLPVAMHGLRAGPVSPLGREHPLGFPADAIRDQDRAWWCGPWLLPAPHNPDRVADVWQTHGLGERPLGRVAHRYRRARAWTACAGDPRAACPGASIDAHDAVGLPLTAIRTVGGMDGIHDRRVRARAGDGDIARNLTCSAPSIRSHHRWVWVLHCAPAPARVRTR